MQYKFVKLAKYKYLIYQSVGGERRSSRDLITPTVSLRIDFDVLADSEKEPAFQQFMTDLRLSDRAKPEFRKPGPNKQFAFSGSGASGALRVALSGARAAGARIEQSEQHADLLSTSPHHQGSTTISKRHLAELRKRELVRHSRSHSVPISTEPAADAEAQAARPLSAPPIMVSAASGAGDAAAGAATTDGSVLHRSMPLPLSKSFNIDAALLASALGLATQDYEGRAFVMLTCDLVEYFKVGLLDGKLDVTTRGVRPQTSKLEDIVDRYAQLADISDYTSVKSSELPSEIQEALDKPRMVAKTV